MRNVLILCLVEIIVLCCLHPAVVGHDESGTKPPKSCPNQPKRSFLLVSTLDGKLSALDLEQDGKLEWSLDLGSEPLLSSSISRLEIARNGVQTRLVPSLDGVLYEFNGETIEALPFTADTLLSSSFKFNDDCLVVGSKDISTYGIDKVTGKVKYFCDKEGCVRFDQKSTVEQEDNVLVVTRKTKTVRAVEMISGAEKWNFSVGEHELSLVKNKIPQQLQKQQVVTNGETIPRTDGDEESYVTSCPEEENFDFNWLFGDKAQEPEIKVVVPTGQILAFSKDNPSHILWSHKFDVPITHVWNLQSDTLNELSVFDDTVVPALEADTTENQTYLPKTPFLYVGVHKNQMYVQQSRPQAEQVNDHMKESNSNKNSVVQMPKVLWKPYLATAMTRTPALIGKTSPLQITWKKKYQPATKEEKQVNESSVDLMVPITEHYPFDGGYYLFPDTTPALSANNVSSFDDDFFTADITVTLWNWWREVVIITIISGFLVHIATVHVMKRFIQNINTAPSQVLTHSTVSAEKSNVTESSESIKTDSAPLLADFSSRFHNEFIYTACLGKGGFGVVFEAKNKMDDCEYAIKRIALNNSDRAREKVMREVKALAKLDHSNIVRYYQAWFENPPIGWQEDQDRLNSDLFPSCTPTPVYSHDGIPSHSSTHNKKSSLSESGYARRAELLDQFDPFAQQYMDYVKFNPLKPFGQLKGSSTLSSSDSSQDKKKGSSGGFVPNLESFTENDNSSTFGDTESFSVGATNSHSNYSRSSNPFYNYTQKKAFNFNEKSNDSLDIVFEDSGCAEKNSDDIFFDNMEEASGNKLATEDLWIESEGLRHRGQHSKSVSSMSKNCDTFDTDIPDDNASFTVEKNDVSTLPLRPESLSFVKKSSEKKVTPTPKLYLYIQMQLCRKEGLKEWLNANTLNRERSQLLDIFDQTVSAVGYIHDNGLMHRDLKPSNIFFSLDGQVKVGDFGLVTASEEKCLDEDFEQEDRRCGLHRHTDQVGTKLYMSPEQAAGGSYSNKVDIYSLGMIFFELFYPFHTQMERIKTLMDVRKGVFPIRFQKELNEEHNFVQELLNKNPEERPSTKGIQRHQILQDYEELRQAVARNWPRNRTISTCSSSSNSTSGPSSPS